MPETPFQQAGDAFGGLGRSMNQNAIAIRRFQYMQAVQQQRQQAMQQQLAIRQALEQAQAAHLGAQTQTETARAGHLGAQTTSEQMMQAAAMQAGQGMRSRYPVDMSQGPTKDAAQQMSLADVVEAVTRAQVLKGRGQQLITPHNVPANAISTDPLTGNMMGQGPTVLGAGAMYQLPGGSPILNPKPPGSGNNLPSMLKYLGEAQKPNVYNETPVMNTGLYTNILDAANAAIQGLRRGGQEGGTGGTGNGVSQQSDKHKSDAMDAIKKGANPEAVRARYKQLTGQDLQ